eukprot:g367.t1
MTTEEKTNTAIDFIQEHQKWVASVKKRDLFVSVGDPKTTGFIKKTTTYAVVSRFDGKDEMLVRRRYSDFDWLYQVLHTRYTGIPIPGLPPKGMVKGDSFMAQRVIGLESFLKELVKNPFLREDVTFNEFIRSHDTGGSWDALKKVALEKAKLPWSERVEAKRWREYLNSMENQGDITSVANVASKFADSLKSAIDGNLSKSKTYGDKSKTLAGGLDDVHKSFESYKSVTYNLADGVEDGCEKLMEIFKDLDSILTVALDGTSVLGDFEMGRSTRKTNFFAETLAIVRGKLVSLKKVLTKYEALKKKERSSKMAHSKAVASYEASQAQGKEDKNDALKIAMKTKESEADQAEKELKAMEISVALVQIPEVLSELRVEFEAKIIYYAKAEAAKENEQKEFWLEQLRKLGNNDPNEALKVALDDLNLISEVDDWLQEVKLNDNTNVGLGSKDIAVKVVEADCV